MVVSLAREKSKHYVSCWDQIVIHGATVTTIQWLCLAEEPNDDRDGKNHTNRDEDGNGVLVRNGGFHC